MSEQLPRENHALTSMALKVDRVRALGRGLVWLTAAVPLLLIVGLLLSRLDFTKTGVHSLLVEASLALLAIPLGVGALVCAFRGFQHLLLGFWIGDIGMAADDHHLTLCLGPFGTRTYPVSELDIKYPFELSGDEESFEAFLPEETQRATMLPRILHPSVREPISRTILRFASGTEVEIAQQVRPWIETKKARRHKGTEARRE